MLPVVLATCIGSQTAAPQPGVQDIRNLATIAEGARAYADSTRPGTSPANVLGVEAPWQPVPYKSHPHWIWIRLKSPARVSRVVVHGTEKLYPVDFAAQTSLDGGRTIRTIFTVTGNASGEPLSRSFRPVLTDNIRIRIDRSSDADLIYHTAVARVEVWGEFVTAKPTQPAATASSPILPSSKGAPAPHGKGDSIEFQTPWLRVALSRSEPCITEFSWDGIGDGQVAESFLKPGAGARLAAPAAFPEGHFEGPTRVEIDGNVVRYTGLLADGSPARWEVRVRERALDIAFASDGVALPEGIRFAFDLDHRCTAPIVAPKPGRRAPLPLLLHAADAGTLLVKCTGADLVENQLREQHRWDATFVPPAKARTRWNLEISVVQPPLPGLARAPVGRPADHSLDAMPRHWLNGFQYHPWTGMLGNNMFNESTSICLYSFAEPAVFTPPLPGGVEPMAMVRESVAGYLRGAPGYATVPDLFVDRWVDAAPSVLMSAWMVVRTTGDLALLREWLPALERLGTKILNADRDGNGLPESSLPGVPGTGVSSNWWDTIGFGHEDAYGIVLDYRALRLLADLEGLADRSSGARRYGAAADRIRKAFVPTFLNPATGVLAGWRDRDGKLHDYWFTWLNGMAIVFGLVPDDLANQILGRFQAKFREVGYTRFDLGLPGNLIPVRREDYSSCGWFNGQGSKEDGSDAFPRYENGGATACFAYYYIQALYQLGRYEEAEHILSPLMAGYAKGIHKEGQGKGGEWRTWAGESAAGEGYLADAYHAQLALYTGHFGVLFDPDGFHLAPWSPLKGKRVPLGLRYMGKVVKHIE